MADFTRVCSSCGSANRIPARHLADTGKCGSCKQPLPPRAGPLEVSTADPILDDTRRLAAALARLGVPCRAEYYPGEPHAFHALIWRENARHCWAHTFEFLHEHVGVPELLAYAPAA